MLKLKDKRTKYQSVYKECKAFMNIMDIEVKLPRLSKKKPLFYPSSKNNRKIL